MSPVSGSGDAIALLGVKLRNLAVRSESVVRCGVEGRSREVVLESAIGDFRRAFSLARRASSESGMLVCWFVIVVEVRR